MSRAHPRRWILVLALALSLAALVQAHHRIQQGRSAVSRWQPVGEALARGEPIYDVDEEGYPTLPLTLLVLAPFHAAGTIAGPMLWALCEVALAWWIVLCALALAAGRVRDYPVLGIWIVLLLSFRVLQSEVLHGNVNMLVGATVATAAWDWSRGRSVRSGVWLGLGAVLKVTPALGLVYFAWKRSLRGLAGMALGLGLGALALPGAVLGWSRNLELIGAWWQQMVAPYAAGRELTLVQTGNVNQSLLGVLARLTTDSVAIAARPPVFAEDVRVNWLSLDPSAFRLVHLAACAAVLALLFAGLRPRDEPRRGWAALGEFSLLALAMLFLSERSWKHHYVLAAFPIAFLCWHALRAPRGSAARRAAIAALSAVLLLFGATGSAVLGAAGSDLAEAYGAYLLGGLAMFLAGVLCLRASSWRTGEAAR